MNVDFNLATFHFLRPEWFYALIPLAILALLLLRRKLFSRNWQSVIDPKLAPHVLIGKVGKQGYWPIAMLLITGIIAIIAQAGPVWQRLPQPVFKQQAAMVIALDLSSSMDAEDIKPSRLQRAQYKLRDLLALRQEGQTALIVYANAAFTVTPLTDDSHTIAAMIPSLATNMLPAQGNHTDAALDKAVELMKNAGVYSGDILLMTDEINNSNDAYSAAQQQGYRVSILGIGTAEGAPIAKSNGDFIKDDQGGIVISKLDAPRLAEAARHGGGRYSNLTTDDRDIKYLLDAASVNRLHTSNTLTEIKTDTWHEQGPWLLLLVIPLAAFAFRKGYIAALFIFLLPLPQPAHALSWDALWKNNNQIAAEKFALDNPQAAAELFTDPQWQAAAHYRAGQFDQAAQALSGINTSDANYNRGNALAKLGKINEAISAYDEALKLDPDNEDARYNRDQLLKQQQQQNNQQQQDNTGQNKAGDAKQDQSGDKQSGQQQPGDQSDNTSGNTSQNKPSDQNKPGESASADNQANSKPDAAKQHDQTSQQTQPAADPAQPSPQQDQKQPEQAITSADKPDVTQQATEQWLRKIPDDPGGLLRRKFKYQYQQQSKNLQDNGSW